MMYNRSMILGDRNPDKTIKPSSMHHPTAPWSLWSVISLDFRATIVKGIAVKTREEERIIQTDPTPVVGPLPLPLMNDH